MLRITLILALPITKAIVRFRRVYFLLEPGHRRNDLEKWEETKSPVVQELGHQLRGASHRVQDPVHFLAAQESRDALGCAGAEVVQRRFRVCTAWPGANRTPVRGASQADSAWHSPG